VSQLRPARPSEFAYRYGHDEGSAASSGIGVAEMPRKWTKEEDQLLLAMKAAGKAAAVIAKQLKRTEASIVSRTVILNRQKQ